jgi:hypothetical protein
MLRNRIIRRHRILCSKRPAWRAFLGALLALLALPGLTARTPPPLAFEATDQGVRLAQARADADGVAALEVLNWPWASVPALEGLLNAYLMEGPALPNQGIQNHFASVAQDGALHLASNCDESPWRPCLQALRLDRASAEGLLSWLVHAPRPKAGEPSTDPFDALGGLEAARAQLLQAPEGLER